MAERDEPGAGPGWVIGAGTVADAGSLVALDQRNFVLGDRFDRGLWRTILNGRIARNRLLTLLARQQGAVVGAIVGEFQVAAGRLAVWSIAVDEAYRGSGLARQLMAELIQRSPPACVRVSLETRRDNARARRFYTRLGFQEVGAVPGGYADGTDAIQYETRRHDLRRALALSPPGPREA